MQPPFTFNKPTRWRQLWIVSRWESSNQYLTPLAALFQPWTFPNAVYQPIGRGGIGLNHLKLTPALKLPPGSSRILLKILDCTRGIIWLTWEPIQCRYSFTRTSSKQLKESWNSRKGSWKLLLDSSNQCLPITREGLKIKSAIEIFNFWGFKTTYVMQIDCRS